MKQQTGSKLANSVRNAKAKQTQQEHAVAEQVAPVIEQAPVESAAVSTQEPPVARLMPSRRVWPD